MLYTGRVPAVLERVTTDRGDQVTPSVFSSDLVFLYALAIHGHPALCLQFPLIVSVSWFVLLARFLLASVFA